MIDIHDTWPESLAPLLPANNFLLAAFFRIWAGLRNAGIANCDFLMAESEEYALAYAHLLPPGASGHVILLGAELDEIAGIIPRPPNGDDRLHVVFSGTIGINYDMRTIVKVIKRRSDFLRSRVCFHFWGAGELLEWLRCELAPYDFVDFEGWTSYGEHIARLKSMDIGINSFTSGTNVRYSYKVTDYLACGLVVLNSLEGSLARDMEEWGIGLNYRAGDPESLWKQLQFLIDALMLDRNRYKDAINTYIKKNLDRNTIYDPLFDYINHEGCMK
ncbi:MAG: hypothetical protein AB7W37_04675 [Syntrophobacteraceae bacterium]